MVRRQCQQRAAQVLAALLASDTPTVRWHIPCALYPHLQVSEPEHHPSLEGQAASHQDVREFAAYFGSEVVLDFGNTPATVSLVDGIGVRVWCAPEYRDDTAPAVSDGGAYE
ncbi:hypothetical protein EFW17_15040 [Halostreptopolyspora alba]|uniref:Uncharacterized protein n=1 Tax=Halostreptopolyspora alba TaxID=2487137 RepID=A0A3N0E7E2_9ACTN|nr:hypothetical protein EFW17_15040 [Nocardiopsaceae bacterium YIM 96095]